MQPGGSTEEKKKKIVNKVRLAASPGKLIQTLTLLRYLRFVMRGRIRRNRSRVFFHSWTDFEDPYIVCSSGIPQQNGTRPFLEE